MKIKRVIVLGFTLTEVLIASALIGVMILAATSYKLYFLRILSSVEDKRAADNRSDLLLSHILFNFDRACDTGLSSQERGFYANDGALPSGIFSDPGNSWYTKYLNAANRKKLLIRKPNGDFCLYLIVTDLGGQRWLRYFPSNVLLQRESYMDIGQVENLQFTRHNFSPIDNLEARNMLTINLSTKQDPSKSEMTILQATVIARAMSCQQ